MSNRPLAGRLILLVEDEPLIAIELDSALRASGARVVSAGYVEAGLFTTEHPDFRPRSSICTSVMEAASRCAGASGIFACRFSSTPAIPAC